MQLPGPLRAAVGLLATAADEAKRLPDRAIELPMLAVSTALQMSLRAQQRYAALTARGDEILSSHTGGEEPPSWATFDDPAEDDVAGARTHGVEPARPADADVFLDDRGWPAPADDGPENGPGDAAGELLRAQFGRAADADTTAGSDAPVARKTPPARKTSPTKKTAPRPTRKAAAKKAATRPAPRTVAKKAPPRPPESPAGVGDIAAGNIDAAPGKVVRAPRHIPPSRFDAVEEDLLEQDLIEQDLIEQELIEPGLDEVTVDTSDVDTSDVDASDVDGPDIDLSDRPDD